jgi:hypothetical protein
MGSSVGSLESNTMRSLTAVVGALALAFASGCGSSPDGEAAGGSGAGGVGGVPSAAGGGCSAASSTFSLRIDYKFDSMGAFTPERAR